MQQLAITAANHGQYRIVNPEMSSHAATAEYSYGLQSGEP